MKKVIISSSFLLALFVASCGSSAEEKVVTKENNSDMHAAYICPCGGCPEIKEEAPGKCPKCDMDLVEEKK